MGEDMRVGEARAAAVDWIHSYARHDDLYRGAYFSGSTIVLPDEAELAASSDVDVVIVRAAGAPVDKLGKLRHCGALLEISYIDFERLGSPDEIASSYHLAPSFRTNTIVDDPTGRLTAIHDWIAPRFAQPEWVRRRCANAERRIVDRLAALSPDAPFADQVTGWLFSAGVITHIPLVAALRNPTVRLRYVAVRQALADYGLSEHYEPMLALMGAANLERSTVQEHLFALATTFDLAAAEGRTPFFFSSDISPAARSISIDGSQQLVDRGDHREAMFWIIATFARCHTILATDAPDAHEERLPAFRAAVADLGIKGVGDIPFRCAEVIEFIPRARAVAELIIESRPAPGVPAG
jgi:hypothetical protein